MGSFTQHSMSRSRHLMGASAFFRARSGRATAVAVVLGALLAVFPTSVAVAESTEPTPEPIRSELRQPDRPTIEAPVGETIKDGTALFTGDKPEDSDIHVVVGDDPTPYCLTRDEQREASTWDCTAKRLPSGEEVSVRAVVVGSTLESTPVEVSVLNPPTVKTSPAGVVSGTSYRNAVVVVATASGSGCTVIPSASTSWSCVLAPVPESGPITVSATQETRWSDGPSEAAFADVVIDSTAPDVPTVISPSNGATVPLTGTTYSGHGEEGATVDLFRSYRPVCSAVVRAGSWSCTGAALEPGANDIKVLQRDAAGNPSRSVSVTVRAVAPSAATPPPSPTRPRTPTATPAPSPSTAPAPEHSHTPPAPEPDESAAAPVPAPRDPPKPPTAAGGTDWNTPSPYGLALAPLPNAFVELRWLTALGIAVGLILLVALPSLLLRRTLTGRIPFPQLRFTGRNRPRADSAGEPLNRWLIAGTCLIVVAGFVAVSLRVEAQENFLRLLLATTIGVALVNVVGIVAIARGFRRTRKTVVHVRIVPAMLLLSAAAALVSRMAGLVPPLIVGQMLGFKIGDGTSEAERTRLALVQSGALTALSVAAWGLYSSIRTTNGFWSSFASETLSTVTLAGLASAVLALLPLGAPIGRSLLRPDVPARLVAGIVVLTIACAALASTTGVWASEALVLLGVTSAAFAALSVAAWLWLRFVEPQR